MRTSIDTRDKKILEAWKSGQTMAQIGESQKPKMSRQSVYQVLVKMGYHKLASERKNQSKKKKEQLIVSREQRQRDRDVSRYGMTPEEINAVSVLPRSHREHPLSIYRTWEKNTNPIGNDGVTFKVWWETWQKSGQWENRGRGAGYWLARKNPDEPFTPENIEIQSGRDVSVETQRRVRVRKKKERNETKSDA